MNCNNVITIVKGNDTDFNGVNLITINLITEILDLSTFKATFKLGKITRNFDDISSGAITINFTAAETLTLPPFSYGTLNLIDTAGKLATIENVIPFKVIDVVDNNAIATEPYTLNFDVKQQGETILNVSVESAVTVELGTTTTLPAGSDATVTNSGSFNHLVLNFGIPRGADGSVLSVNGKTGDVVLDYTDVGANPLITDENMLNADLVDDTTAVHKFATAEELAQIETNKNDITALDNKYDSITGGLSDSIIALDNKYDSVTGALDDKIDSINGALSDSITALDSVVSGNFTTLSDSITALDSVVSSNYTTLDGKIDSVNGALSDSITGLDTKYDSITGALDTKIDNHIGDTLNPHAVTKAQVGLGNVDNTSDANKPISTATQNALDSISGALSNEADIRQNADNGLQSQIDAIVVSSDVFDVVGTYAELQAYDISTVPVNDIIKVLVDSTHDNAATYYRCVENNNVKSWSYIGAEGAYYTKSEADGRFVPLTRTVNNKALSSNITLTASDIGALPDNTTIGDATLTIQVNSSTVDTFTANATSNKSINIQCATPSQGTKADTALQPNDNITELTNNAGYITNSALSGYATETYVDNGLDAKEDVFSVGDGLEFAQGGQEIQPVVTLPYTFTDSYTGVQFFNNLTSGETKTAVFKIPSTGGYYYIGNDARRGIRISWGGDDIWLCDARSGEENNWEHFTASTDNYLKIISYNGGATDVFYSHDNSTWTLLMDKDRPNQLMGFGGEVGIYVEGDLITVDYFKLYYGTGTETTLNVDNTIARVTDIPTNNNQLTNGAGYITSSALANYMTTDTAQDVSGRKTFLGEKAIYFKQSATTDKLGFTLYNPSDSELAALEWRPSTVNGNALLALNCPQAGSNYVGFRYWANINIVAPRPATNGTYFIPVNITNGNTTVTASSAGTVDISSLMPSLSGYQTTANLVTSVSSSSTDSQYPSAKLFYDTCGDIETLINAL